MNPGASVQVGLFGIGLETYWDQFEGLKSRLENHQAKIADRMRSASAEVLNAGMVDQPQTAREVGDRFLRSGPDILFVYVSTYALSSTVLPVVQRLGVPIVVLCLQPRAQLDYEAFNRMEDRGAMTGRWLEYCQVCSAPEIASVFNRAGIPFHMVTGYLDDESAWVEIFEWIAAARVARGMRENRVGVLGHYYNGMLDVYSDLTQHAAVFGNHFEMLEMSELEKLHAAVTEDRLRKKLSQFRRDFEVSPHCEAKELERAARTSCALDELVEKHELGSLAYYYEGEEGTPLRDIATSVIAGNTLLTGRHVPVAGECEIKNVQAMKILDLLGVGGSFSEFYLGDFNDDVVYLGHDGPAHFSIAEGRVGLVPLPVYHGKPGRGLSIQMTVAHGPVTLLSVVQNRAGELSFLVAEGESVPGPILQLGNTNSRYRFSIGAREFINRWSSAGPSHHCAIGVGHVASRLAKLAKILGLAFHAVC